MPSDVFFIQSALRLARRGLYTAAPNPRVGCVIVRDQCIVGSGWHMRCGLPHAERSALRDAGEAAVGATAYITLEPCSHQGRTPPCTTALIAAGIKRVVFAADDDNPQVNGRKVLETAGIAVQGGVMTAAAQALNPGFHRRMRVGLPWLRCKLAATLDGRTALADGNSRWITGVAARADVHRWRARSGAILCGINTVLRDNPRLDVRGMAVPYNPPLKIILDRHLRAAPDAAVFCSAGSSWWVHAEDCAPARVVQCRKFKRANTQLHALPCKHNLLDLEVLLRRLARAQINEVWVESGARLCGALLAGGWVNQLVLYFAPRFFGSEARGMFDFPLHTIADAPRLQIEDMRAIGEDWRMMARPVYG